MKTLLIAAIALFAVSGFATAQTCDMNMSMTMLHKGEVKLKLSPEYKGLTNEQAADLMQRSMAVVDEAKKGQDKRGDYTFKFDGNNTCGVTVTPGVVDGLTHKDSMRVWRKAFKVAEVTLKKSEEHVARGGKAPWGK